WRGKPPPRFSHAFTSSTLRAWFGSVASPRAGLFASIGLSPLACAAVEGQRLRAISGNATSRRIQDRQIEASPRLSGIAGRPVEGHGLRRICTGPVPLVIVERE